MSGGQKSLLKLARTLSIASMKQLPFLLLDETITHLDAETTGQVAQLLHTFTIQAAPKFYVVTHAPQIQALNTRDGRLVLDEYITS